MASPAYTGVTDDYLSDPNPANNYGTNTDLAVSGYADSGANMYRPVIRFDLSSITSGTTITNAKLYVFAYDQTAWRGSSGYYGVYPLTRGFTESQVTWTIAATGTNWTTPGGDFNATADAQASKQGVAGVWYAFDVTSRVQSMVNTPSGNYGWVLKCTDETLHNQDNFVSSNNTDLVHRPKLVVNY